jgi:hypothetical protein
MPTDDGDPNDESKAMIGYRSRNGGENIQQWFAGFSKK